MSNLLSVAEVIAPIFVAICLGILARKKAVLSAGDIRGLQQFVMNFALPCIIFNSCLTAQIGIESIGTMLLVLPCMLLSTFLAFSVLKKKFGYHNLPMLFAAQETGMLGIPLFMILFGADQAYRIGVLDLIQGCTAFPVIAILSSKAEAGPSPREILRNMFRSPLLIMSLTGLFLNITGIGAFLHSIGLRDIITSTMSFLGQPVSALMIFCVGYNFSLDRDFRTPIMKIAGFHFALFAVFCVVMQGALFLIPNTNILSRWAILLYCLLPASYLAPSLGKDTKDFTVASGVCSLLTPVTLIGFCILAALA